MRYNLFLNQFHLFFNSCSFAVYFKDMWWAESPAFVLFTLVKLFMDLHSSVTVLELSLSEC